MKKRAIREGVKMMRAFSKFRHYFTLWELLTWMQGGNHEDDFLMLLGVEKENGGQQIKLRDVIWTLTDIDTSGNEFNNAPMSKDICEKLWCEYILPAHHNDYCIYIDTVNPELKTIDPYDPNYGDNPAILKAAREFGIALNSVLLNTYDKYNDLITYYNDLKAGLTAGPNHVTTNKWKDLPQDAEDTSNPNIPDDIRIIEENRDVDNKALRLKEILDTIQNLMYEWSQEFDELFIASAGDGADEALNY